MREREREREREAATQVEGEAVAIHGAQPGTGSQVSRIRLWVEGGAKPVSHQGCLDFLVFNTQGSEAGEQLGDPLLIIKLARKKKPTKTKQNKTKQRAPG